MTDENTLTNEQFTDLEWKIKDWEEILQSKLEDEMWKFIKDNKLTKEQTKDFYYKLKDTGRNANINEAFRRIVEVYMLDGDWIDE